MSSAKRTPRYVDAIRSYDLPAGSSSDVIRLRPESAGPALAPITKAWPRRRAVPVAQRPWQLLLVPPTPGAQTRSFNVARWQARLVMIAAGAVLIVAGAGITALVLAVRTPDLFATSAEAAMLRSRLTVVEDSLAMARAELEAPDDSLAASAVGGSVAPVTATPFPTGSRLPTARVFAPPANRALSKRTAASSDDDASSLTTRGIEGLPVIGAIASRFSRARRHPLLHVIRPHLGVDVAAPRGSKIIAPSPGRVSFVGRKFGFGLVVEIQHRDGVSTRYAHCGSALVAEGDQVQRGTAIATVGTSGLSTGPHLHYEVLVHGHQVDPLRFRMPQMGDSTATAAPQPSSAARPASGASAATPGAAPETTTPE
ncbi:MAG TPA: M23 family metallopeptidase [Gemmatimonadaceae bacterium]|nr:M23 family metallopeptidase [Gemmatimonadaceae bacterium]